MKELLEKILWQIKKTPEGVRAYEDLYHICLETQKTDIPLSVEYLKKLSDIIENRIPQSETDKELRSLFMLHKKVLLAAAPFDFESYLTLSVTTKYKDLKSIADKYDDVDWSIIFTKLDETRSFGNLISFAHKTKKSITYFSIGQNVPDDLIVSDSTFLIDCFMNKQCIRR